MAANLDLSFFEHTIEPYALALLQYSRTQHKSAQDIADETKIPLDRVRARLQMAARYCPGAQSVPASAFTKLSARAS